MKKKAIATVITVAIILAVGVMGTAIYQNKDKIETSEPAKTTTVTTTTTTSATVPTVTTVQPETETETVTTTAKQTTTKKPTTAKQTTTEKPTTTTKQTEKSTTTTKKQTTTTTATKPVTQKTTTTGKVLVTTKTTTKKPVTTTTKVTTTQPKVTEHVHQWELVSGVYVDPEYLLVTRACCSYCMKDCGVYDASKESQDAINKHYDECHAEQAARWEITHDPKDYVAMYCTVSVDCYDTRVVIKEGYAEMNYKCSCGETKTERTPYEGMIDWDNVAKDSYGKANPGSPYIP